MSSSQLVFSVSSKVSKARVLETGELYLLHIFVWETFQSILLCFHFAHRDRRTLSVWETRGCPWVPALHFGSNAAVLLTWKHVSYSMSRGRRDTSQSPTEKILKSANILQWLRIERNANFWQQWFYNHSLVYKCKLRTADKCIVHVTMAASEVFHCYCDTTISYSGIFFQCISPILGSCCISPVFARSDRPTQATTFIHQVFGGYLRSRGKSDFRGTSVNSGQVSLWQ